MPREMAYGGYNLYYVTNKLFYFCDAKNMVGNGNDKYYLGVMGCVTIESEAGDEFGYVGPQQFNELKENYEKHLKDEQVRKDLLHHYTFNSNGEMQIYKLVDNINTYEYIFKRDNNCIITKQKEDKNSTRTVDVITADIQNTVDSSLYNISIELLTDFLDLTGSPEYIDKFIDYAIEKTRVTITAYPIESEEKSYEIDTHNIEDKFIFEAYDMADVANQDIKRDNMITYKPLIYDRIYNGNRFEGSIVDLSDFESIDYGTDSMVNIISTIDKYIGMAINVGSWGEFTPDIREERKEFYKEKVSPNDDLTKDELIGYLKGDGIGEWFIETLDKILGGKVDEYLEDYAIYICDGADALKSASPIKSYLKCAYETSSGFKLGAVEVQEASINTKKETSWQFYATKINTWYGNIKYNDINKTREYTIDENDSTVDEYNKLGPTLDKDQKSIDYNPIIQSGYATYKDIADVEKKEILIADMREAELKSKGIGIGSDPNVQVLATQDIFSDFLYFSDSIFDIKEEKLAISNKEEYFRWWNLAGLGTISANDGGNYNSGSSAGQGTDYIYAKYKMTNGKDYETIRKSYYDIIEIGTTLPTVSTDKVKEFLALWKNTGGIYDSNGTLVAYNDIYNGKTRVGDIFESAPEMTFNLLESSDSTKGLVNIFKYIMYVYTGTDYGITDESQIAFIFDISPYGGSDYTVNTPMSDTKLVLEKDQLEKAIKSSYNGDIQKNLLSCVDDFMYIQENNKVNAVFAAAVTIIESSGGTNWAAIDPSTYNWYSIKGSYNGNSKNGWRAYSSFNEATRDFGDLIANGAYYFKAGKYTVTAIAPTYCNEEWGNLVVSEMTKIYNSVGISGATGGTEGKTGNYTTFTANGRTYINYKQKEEAYKSIPLACYPNTTLFKAGCGITSDAIIGSGFGSNKDPIAVNNFGSNNHQEILGKLTGKEWVSVQFSKTAVLDELKKGNPVIVRVEGDGGYFKSEGHFTTILSISEDGNSIYISDPAFKTDSKNGWMKTSILNASGYVRFTKLAN